MQHNFDIPNQQGAGYRADVNSALQALATLSSGPTPPTAPYPNMWWMDTSSTPPVLRRRNADNTFWQVVDPGTANSYFKRNADGDVVALSPEELAGELGLGTAATHDVTTSPTDTTPGRVLTVGSLGLGEPILLTSSDDLDDIMSPGIYRHSQVNAPANTPVPEAGIVTVFTGEPSNFVVQVWRRRNGQVREFQRTFDPSSGVWNDWVEFYHTGNLALPIGVNQTWQYMGSSRVMGTTYTNTTGRPIMVAIKLEGPDREFTFYVNNVLFFSGKASGYRLWGYVWAIVPPGNTYRMDTDAGVYRWMELR